MDIDTLDSLICVGWWILFKLPYIAIGFAMACLFFKLSGGSL